MELDSLNTQQSLREAISDSEVAAAKQRHQQVLDFIQVKLPFPEGNALNVHLWLVGKMPWEGRDGIQAGLVEQARLHTPCGNRVQQPKRK